MKLTFLVLFFPSILFQFSLEAKGFDPLIDVAVGDRAELAINNPNNLSKTGEPSVSGGSETGSLFPQPARHPALDQWPVRGI
jgi:hypothetical protein